LIPRLIVIVEGYFIDNPAPIITNGIYYDFQKFTHSVSGKLTPFTSMEVPNEPYRLQIGNRLVCIKVHWY
jgi:hypothetical protein